MKKNYMTSMLMLFVLTFSTVQLFAQAEKEKLMSEINKMNKQMIKAGLSGDISASGEFYADDVYHMPNYSPMIEGKSAVMKHAQESHEAGIKMLAMDLKTHELIISGKNVIEIGFFTVEVSIPGMPEPVSDKGKYVTIWEKQGDGSLKIKLETWNTDVSPMETMNNKVKEKAE